MRQTLFWLTQWWHNASRALGMDTKLACAGIKLYVVPVEASMKEGPAKSLSNC